MSSQSVSSAGSVSALGAGSPLQITGLASGLDTNAIISALIAVDRQPITNLTNQQTGLQALNTQLQSIRTALKAVADDAWALADPTLFSPAQTISSSNTALVTATASSTSGIGAVIGGYEVDVTQLASSAQATYQFTSQAQSNTITIGGHDYNLAANGTVTDLANAINADANGSVWAAVTTSSGGNGTIVFSDRATGSQATDITVSEQNATTSLALTSSKDGTLARYSINGVAQADSASNTVTTAIPGVNLTLNGITGSTPATVNVGAPAPSASTIETAVNQFVKDYNAAVDQINAQLTQKASSSDPTQGQLFGDQDLTSLLNQMRTTNYTPISGLSGVTSLTDIGISTGAPSGGGATSADALEGKLTVNTATLATAIQNNPNGVKSMLQSWSNSLYSLVDAHAGTGGTLDNRINGDDTEISALGDRISAMNEMLQTKEKAMIQQYAALEAALAKSQSEGNWLSQQIASMSANNG